MPGFGIAIGGATATPGLITLPGSAAVRLTVRSVRALRNGRARYSVDLADPVLMNGAKEVIGAAFRVGPGGLVITETLRFDPSSPDVGIVLVNIFVAELDSAGHPIGEEDGTSVTLGVL